jgi:hypothetical protein
VFAGLLTSADVPTTVAPLPEEEVLYSVSRGNRKARFCSIFVFQTEPSDGLEPSTPSLPCFALPEGARGTALDCGFSLLLRSFRCQSHHSLEP